MNQPLKRYKSTFEHSYAFGVFATIELLIARPEDVLRVIVSSRSQRNRGVKKLEGLCGQAGVPLEENDKTIARVSPKESHLAIGVFRKYTTSLEPEVDHVVLYQPSDMGNLGTIARTMVGFGMTNLAMIRPAADILAPRAVRASMGAVFRLAVEYFDGFDAYRERFAHHLYPLTLDAEAQMGGVRFAHPYSLMLGNEGEGIPDEIADLGTRVTIPHSGDVDSLNLSIAAGIALYEAYRQRSSSS